MYQESSGACAVSSDQYIVFYDLDIFRAQWKRS
jgi:hypothetical protein